MDLSDGLCPFVCGITLANIVNVLWRTRFLKSKTIGILSRVENGQKRRQSDKAIKWLEWESRECGQEIQTAVAGGEKRIGRYFVDGFLNNRIFEFYGCHWHGCLQCNHPDTVHPQRGVKMSYIHQETVERQEFLESKGHPVTVMWEHDFDQRMKDDLEFRDFVNDHKVRAPLAPRDAFKGGRVNAFKLLHNVTGDEKIHYYDVTSGECSFKIFKKRAILK